MGVDKGLLPVLIVALLTWGGVFFYMLRLEALARSLERQVKARAESQDDVPQRASLLPDSLESR
jgi:hypothetical protein